MQSGEGGGSPTPFSGSYIFLCAASRLWSAVGWKWPQTAPMVAPRTNCREPGRRNPPSKRAADWPAKAPSTADAARARLEVARQACVRVADAYIRLVDLRVFECTPIVVPADGQKQPRALLHNRECAQRDTMGVLCAAMTILRQALRLDPAEAMVDGVYDKMAAALLLAQKAKTEQQWAGGAQPAAIVFSVCAPRDVVLRCTAERLTARVEAAEVWMLTQLPTFALLERNPHAATEVALHGLVRVGACTLDEAVRALDACFLLYWQTVGTWEVEVWHDAPDGGLAQSSRLGGAYACVLMPKVAAHLDAETNALAVRFRRVRELAAA
jgi:hypothetical protein